MVLNLVILCRVLRESGDILKLLNLLYISIVILIYDIDFFKLSNRL